MTLIIDPFTLQLLLGAYMAYLARRQRNAARSQRATEPKPPKRRTPQ